MKIKLVINSRRTLEFNEEDDLFGWIRSQCGCYVLIHETDSVYSLHIDREEFNDLFPKFAY